MAYLNWKNSSKLRAERATHPKYQTQLTLTLSAEEIKDLVELFSETLLKNPETQANAEVRTDFLQVSDKHTYKWSVYWKIKFGQSRMTLAHPNADEWVASVTLNREHAQETIAAIGQLIDAPQESNVNLATSTTLAALSNIELIIKHSK